MQEILIIINIIILEAILSIDNASILATMVKHLPKEQQSKALKYWILWAYIFRWLSLVLISFLFQVMWLKFIWWLYLLYLTYKFFTKLPEEEGTKSLKSWFWKTVIIVEIMDLAFSIDNIFAVVAMTPNIYLIIIWVFIGILAMRFLANIFVSLMNKYPFLETSAYMIIWFLWVKLILSYLVIFTNNPFLIEIINWHISDLITSIITIMIFIFPIIINYVRQNILNSSSK